MLSESEPRRPPRRSLELVDSIADRIRPDDPNLAEWFSRYRAQHRHRLAADLRLVESHVASGSRVLECGAVPLVTTGALVALGFRVDGIDLAPARFATAIADLGLAIARCDLETETLPFADGTFDAVVFHELFEHLRINPIETFRQVRRVLRGDGRLLLSTPNLRSFRGLRNLLVHHRGAAASSDIYRQYEKLETLGHMGHVREYTVREVADFLSRAGFRVDKVVYRGGHGSGVVGLAERLTPSLRPFFSLIAVKNDVMS